MLIAGYAGTAAVFDIGLTDPDGTPVGRLWASQTTFQRRPRSPQVRCPHSRGQLSATKTTGRTPRLGNQSDDQRDRITDSHGHGVVECTLCDQSAYARYTEISERVLRVRRDLGAAPGCCRCSLTA